MTSTREVTLTVYLGEDGNGRDVTFRAEYEYQPGYSGRIWNGFRQDAPEGAGVEIGKVWLWEPHAHGDCGNWLEMKETGWALMRALGMDKALEAEILAEREWGA